MEGFGEGLTKLLQEILPHGKKVLVETNVENKKIMKYDFIDSNIRFKKNHIPKIDMRKFYGKDLVTCILL